MIGVSPGLSQQSLGGLLGLSPSALVWLIDELESKNLIRRREDPNDRRAHALYLTGSGRQILAKLKNLAASEEHGLLECLSAAEREQLNSTLTDLGNQQE
jgi:DNA-binding MarR family transcriptional regulator